MSEHEMGNEIEKSGKQSMEAANKAKNAAKETAKAPKKAMNAGKNAIKNIKRGIKGAKLAAKGAETTVKVAASHPIITAVIIIVIVLICVITGGVSQSQMDKTYYLTPKGEVNEDGDAIYRKPSKSNRDDSINDISVAKEQTQELLSVIAGIKLDEKEDEITSAIKSKCSELGVNYDLSMENSQESFASYTTSTSDSNIKVDDEDEDDASDKKENNTKTTSKKTTSKKTTSTKSDNKSTGNVIQEFDVSGGDHTQLSTFVSESAYQGWIYEQGKIFGQKSKWYIDNNNFAKWKNDDGTEDFMVALGPYFGNTIGNRYRITFKNGTVITALLADVKNPEHTVAPAASFKIKPSSNYLNQYNDAQIRLNFGVGTGFSGYCPWSEAPKYGGKPYYSSVIEFISGGSTPNYSIFDTIKSFELIEGKMVSNIGFGSTEGDNELLAAYSVSIDNMEVSRWKEQKNWLGIKKYTNSHGIEVATDWFATSTDDVNFEKDIKKKMKKYVKNGGKFYDVSFEMANGKIAIKTKTTKTLIEEDEQHEHLDADNVNNPEDSGTNIVIEDGKKYRVEKIKYIVPIIKEKASEDYMYDMFGIKADEPYINDDRNKKKPKNGITNLEATAAIAEETTNLLNDGEDDSSSGDLLGADLGGKYGWPLSIKGTITSWFGNRPASDTNGIGSTNHGGLDIGAPTGTPVCAIESGTVTMASWYGGYGNCIQISHAGNVVSLYGHLSKIGVKKGQKVTRGQQIGEVGSTGNSTGPHLHLSIFQNGTAIDPYPCITKSN